MSDIKALQKVEQALRQRGPMDKTTRDEAAKGQAVTLNNLAARDKSVLMLFKDATMEYALGVWKKAGGENVRRDIDVDPIEHLKVVVEALEEEIAYLEANPPRDSDG